MYFGSANLDSIFRFLNGWQAHRRCVADDDPVAEAFKGFNEYVEAKYDDNRTVGWANMISEHTDNPDEEYQVFMNIFREFLSEKKEI